MSTRFRSLRSRLVSAVMAPLTILVLLFAATTCWLSQKSPPPTSDPVLGGAALILLVALPLFWWAITWGLRPFSALAAQLENTHDAPPLHFRLNLPPDMPREAIPFVGAFNAMMARTEKATVSLRQFTGNASHQMRTPLAVVRVHLDLLQRFGPDTPQGRAALADTSSAIESLERLLLQLISLARTEEQVIDPAMSFDLAETAAAVAGERVVRNGDDIELSYERSDPGPIPAHGHPVLAAELIGNLVDNAFRYNRPGGSVTVRVGRAEGRPCVAIEDDGPGIPLAERDKVWQRFYRGVHERDPVGSGLGLPIVRALAEQMGAAVSLRSGPHGRGLCATVEFQAAA